MTDAFVKLLNRYGYQPVFLPRTGVVPPELYTFAAHRLIRRGPLERYLSRPAAFGTREGALADIEGQVSSGKDQGAGLSFLKSALAALGVSDLPTADLSFTGAKTLSFAFSKIVYRGIDPADLDQVVQGLRLPPSIPDGAVEDGALHIAFEYAYARALTLQRADGLAFATELRGGLTPWFKVGAKVKAEVHANARITFTALDAPAAFAYKAGRLHRIGERWIFEPEIVARARGAATVAERRSYIPAERIVLRVEEG